MVEPESCKHREPFSIHGKPSVTAGRTHSSYLSSSFLSLEQLKQAHLHRRGDLHCLWLDTCLWTLQGWVHQHSPMRSSHQIHSRQYYWVMQPRLCINASWTSGNSLLRWIHEYRNYMSYTHVADSQVYFKWVETFVFIGRLKVASLFLNSQLKKPNGCLKYMLMLSGIKKKNKQKKRKKYYFYSLPRLWTQKWKLYTTENAASSHFKYFLSAN